MGHCNVCKPMTKCGTLMWDPPIVVKFVFVCGSVVEKGSVVAPLSSDGTFLHFSVSFVRLKISHGPRWTTFVLGRHNREVLDTMESSVVNGIDVVTGHEVVSGQGENRLVAVVVSNDTEIAEISDELGSCKV